MSSTLIATAARLPGQLLDSITLTAGVLVLFAVTVYVVLYTYHPRVSQATVLSFAPWVIVGSALPILAGFGGYPPLLEPVVTLPWAYVTAIFLPALVWTVLLDLSHDRNAATYHPYYIVTIGIGAAMVVTSYLILQAAPPLAYRLALLFLVPLIAILAAVITVVLFGFWHPELMAYADTMTGFVVFGGIVDGLATTADVGVHGASAHSAMSQAVMEIVTTYSVDIALGYPHLQVWAGLYVWVKILIAIVITATLADYAADQPARVYPVFGLLGAIGLAAGMFDLFVILVGG